MALNQKIIAIVGPTASGKSKLALELALFISKKIKTINGAEIISADSRQIYKNLPVGTNQPTAQELKLVPHHLIGFLKVNQKLNVTQYQKKAFKIIQKLWKQNKVPIICGGTGFYLRAVIDGIIFPSVPPNQKLRKTLEKKSKEELLQILQKEGKQFLKNIDPNNKKRLIRAIEIIKKLKKIPPLKSHPLTSKILIIGIKVPKEKLKAKIKTRTKKMLKQGLLTEGKFLLTQKLSPQKINELGFIYNITIQYLQKQIKTKQELEAKINQATFHYVKRQLTWFKKDQRIIWVSSKNQAQKLVKNFLSNTKK